VRLMYAYPSNFSDEMIGAFAEIVGEGQLVPYIDIPLQHASGPMLAAMRRGVTRDGQERILDRIREYVPDITVRTTFIVGFPGETDQDFAELIDFVEKQQFDHVGVFTYFQEDGTPAATLDRQVPDHVKKARQKRLMDVQKKISRNKLKKLVGTDIDVLIEGVSEESDLLLRGRTARQAPDVDGQVYVSGAGPDVKIGQIRPMRVTQVGDYDLVGELLDEAAVANG